MDALVNRVLEPQGFRCLNRGAQYLPRRAVGRRDPKAHELMRVPDRRCHRASQRKGQGFPGADLEYRDTISAPGNFHGLSGRVAIPDV